MLKVERLTVSFSGNTVLDGLGIELHDGSKCVIVGQNGSGKTTLFRALLNLLVPDMGAIRYNGSTLGSRFKALDISGNLPECYRLLPLNCRDLIMAYSEIKDLDRKEVLADVSRFSLDGILGEKPWRLSTGQQKLLYSILALSGRNSITVLDEPFENIDFQRKRMLMDMIDRSRSSVILSTHDSSVLEMMGGWGMHLILAGKLFGPLDPTMAHRYYFSLGERSDSVLNGELRGSTFSISLDRGDVAIMSIEKVSSLAWGLQQ